MKQKFTLISASVRSRVLEIIQTLPLDPPHEISIAERKSTRNLEQNAKMWATLTDIAQQVEWHGQHLSKEEWKDIFTASLKQQKVVPGLDSGFVVLGAHTSKMSVAEMSEMIELATAFGCQHNVKWHDPTIQE